MSDGPRRGGARAGAGRKPKDGLSGKRLKALRIDDASITLAEELGDGDFAVGVRSALRLVTEIRRTVVTWTDIEAMWAEASAWGPAPAAGPMQQLPKAQQRNLLNLMLGDRERKLARD